MDAKYPGMTVAKQQEVSRFLNRLSILDSEHSCRDSIRFTSDLQLGYVRIRIRIRRDGRFVLSLLPTISYDLASPRLIFRFNNAVSRD